MKVRNRFFHFLLKPWALVPCVLLFIGTYILAGLAGMTAEDFDRPMTLLEQSFLLLPWVPVIWFVSIIGKIVTKIVAGKK